MLYLDRTRRIFSTKDLTDQNGAGSEVAGNLKVDLFKVKYEV